MHAGASPPSLASALAYLAGPTPPHAALHCAGLAGVPQGARSAGGARQAVESLVGRQRLEAVGAAPSCGCCRGAGPQPSRRCGCWHCGSWGRPSGCGRRCAGLLRDSQQVARLETQRGNGCRGIGWEGQRAGREARAHLQVGVVGAVAGWEDAETGQQRLGNANRQLRGTAAAGRESAGRPASTQ